MKRLNLLAACMLAAALVGCGAGKDEGVTVQKGQGPSTQDVDQRIAAIQADTHMPDNAKQVQIAQLQAAKARAAASGGK